MNPTEIYLYKVRNALLKFSAMLYAMCLCKQSALRVKHFVACGSYVKSMFRQEFCLLARQMPFAIGTEPVFAR